jgi:hypothetical protein
MMAAPRELIDIVGAELARPVPSGAYALAERIRDRHGSSVRAVLLYGSCLRNGDDGNGLLDLYALVDRYHGAYKRSLLTLMNRVLPPNVFYLEARVGNRVVRAKYGVLTLADLSRFTSEAAFGPYFWARFAQPCALVYAADEDARTSVAESLANAIVTFTRCGLPLVPERFDSRELWTATLRATYGTELRAERPHVVDTLYRSAPERYERVTQLALAALGDTVDVHHDAVGRFTARLPKPTRLAAGWAWRWRSIRGKTSFLLRILRNAIIFEGGVDYIMWKIERHSGIATDGGWRDKRHPLLALGAEAWRLYRAGAFR